MPTKTTIFLIVITLLLTTKLMAQDRIPSKPINITTQHDIGIDIGIYEQYVQAREKTDTIFPLFYPFFSKKQIEDKLENLDTIPYNVYTKFNSINISMNTGHCHYRCTNEVISYICSICGEKTLYKTPKVSFDFSPIKKQIIIENKNCREMEPLDVHFISCELKKYRQKIQKINGIRIALDESEFCANCCPFVKKPQLYLLINIEGETETNRITNFYFSDTQLLIDFFNNNLFYFSKTSLENSRNRLKELLGIKYD